MLVFTVPIIVRIINSINTANNKIKARSVLFPIDVNLILNIFIIRKKIAKTTSGIILLYGYSKANLLKINTESITSHFVYPYLAGSEKEANRVVKELEREGKTIFRYWNNLPQDFNEYKFYSRLVPIPLS